MDFNEFFFLDLLLELIEQEFGPLMTKCELLDFYIVIKVLSVKSTFPEKNICILMMIVKILEIT